MTDNHFGTEIGMSAGGNPSRKPVLCLVGPTASGKSDLGVQVAKAVGGEVLSADSMQVYRGMDIGTAKMTQEEMQGIPHHLIDLVPPDAPFTVADWTRFADERIEELHRRGTLPIVVGGTGLYIRSVVEDLDFASKTGSEEIRIKWQQYLDEHGNQKLHEALQERDPVRASQLHPNDVRRVIRALEVFETDKQPMSAGYDWRVKGGRYGAVQFGLTMDREHLYERINQRVDKMARMGLKSEVSGLLDEGYGPQLTSMQAIGYKEMVRAVQGAITEDEALEDIKQATRRFAKRQMSWFRADSRVSWLHLTQEGVPKADLERLFRTADSLAAGIRLTVEE